MQFKCILNRRWCDLHQGVFQASKFGLLFWEVPMVPPLQNVTKRRDLGALAKFVIARICGHFWSCRLQQNVFLCLHFKRILIKRWCDLVRSVSRAYFYSAYFFKKFLLVTLCKISENARYRCPYQICDSSDLRALFKLTFPAKCWPMFCDGVFDKILISAYFFKVSIVPPFEKSHKMSFLVVRAKFLIIRICGHFWNCLLQQNVVLCLHFKRILIKKWCDLVRSVWRAPNFVLLFWEVPLDLPFKKFQKMRVLGVLAKFAITRLYGQFWSRGLQQTVVLCFNFKRILNKR